MDFEQVKTRLSKIDTSSLADTNKQLRVMDGEIRPVSPGLKMVGRAHTVRIKDDFFTVLKALEEAEKDEVLVIDTGGMRPAVAGELFSLEAKRKGMAGFVIDGAFRDTAKVRTIDFPVFCRRVIPSSGTLAKIMESQVPIVCGGVPVNPGDIVFGDDDGVVVTTDKELEELLSRAEEVQSKEDLIINKIESGGSLFDTINYDEHIALLKAGKKSKLRYTI